MKHRDGAFTAIELCLGMAISMPILLAFTSLLLTSVKTETRLRTERIAIEITLKAQGALDSIMMGVDSHPLPISPIIHSHGNLRLNDGSPLSTGRSFPPDGVSDAVTGASLVFHDRLIMSHRMGDSSRIEGEACPAEDHDVSLSEIRSYIGLSIEGLSEIKGETTRLGRCFAVNLYPVKSILTVDPLPYPSGVRVIIPVRWIHTYYISQGGALRLLSHSGEQILENQPIVQGVARLSVIALESSYGVPSLSFSLLPLLGRPVTGRVTSHIGRAHHLNTLLYPEG